MKLFSLALAAVAAAATFSANAAIITVGALTRDTTGPTIVDTMNNRYWLGFDVTRGLTYAQTVAATGVGGMFEGYSIAHNADAVLFANAMAGGANPCSTGLTAACLTGSQVAENVTGESYSDSRSEVSAPYDYDYAWFLSDNGSAQEVGYVQVYTDDKSVFDKVSLVHEWSTIGGADSFANGLYSIGWLLYRDANNTVPEPGSIALFSLGLLAAAGARRRNRKQVNP